MNEYINGLHRDGRISSDKEIMDFDVKRSRYASVQTQATVQWIEARVMLFIQMRRDATRCKNVPGIADMNERAETLLLSLSISPKPGQPAHSLTREFGIPKLSKRTSLSPYKTTVLISFYTGT